MLDEIEKELLACLTFEESLAHLLEEMDYSKAIIVDILKSLLMKEMVQAFYFDEEKDGNMPTAFYDSDSLGDFLFRISAKGLKALYGV